MMLLIVNAQRAFHTLLIVILLSSRERVLDVDKEQRLLTAWRTTGSARYGHALAPHWIKELIVHSKTETDGGYGRSQSPLTRAAVEGLG